MDYSNADVLDALDLIKNICIATYNCEDCPFMKNGSCYIKHVDPEKWEISHHYIWRAFK